ncbi:MAG: DUF3579 domain-containing protein [Pseudomonadota bacterium]
MLQEQMEWAAAPGMESRRQFFDVANETAEKCEVVSFATAVVVTGVGQDGRPFRPSDWCQRLAAAATINCSYCIDMRGRIINPYVKVVIEDGIYSLWIARILNEIDPPLYDFMVMFGRNNGLRLYSI